MNEVQVNQEQFNRAQQEIQLLKKQNVAVLGDGEVFVKRTNGGALRSIKGAVTLNERNGEIATIQGKTMTTAKGFNTLNQIAGLSIITPEKLTLPDGQVVVNPYPIIDHESGTISKVWVKKIAIGYSPTGNLVITSSTLLYDIKMYFIQDVMKKVQYSKDAGRVCMEQMMTEEEKKNCIFLKIEGFLGVAANIQHKDVLKAIDTYINKKQFAERNAQSICERLVMSKHPALASAAYVTKQGEVARVPVVGYVHDFNREELLEIADKAERGEEVVVRGKKADVIEAVVEATEADITVDADDEEILQSSPIQEEQEYEKVYAETTRNEEPASNLFNMGRGEF
ncbi:hypothetical protein NCCP2222_19520 [Sporosarcina sp. NCCP-2222]|uniref:hypothetical protein n=1 Tax=Sporosarcina sp. NCCP-2222 TaxID=2935073 RepID=UPI00207D7BB0|nr:hypothetical protein [Sporosarcina sp. NCCP-2222]GKV56005.1 hypothetical protein NCCP2222_19520 [Sporosarcina sp. NCCP-2222]